jgi:tetratricopeptide (TPR) repeat protein
MRAALTVIVTAAILAGCGSAPPLQTTAEARRDRQLDLSDNGRRAVARGDLRRAAVHYREALRLAEETEDFRGIAVNTLNLAAIWQALGERERAQQALDRITDSPARFDNRFVADAAGRQAQLALLAERLDAAEQWLARAEGICQAPSCQSRTALINLRGQLSLARGSTEEARNLAARALAASRAEGNREEEANA